MSMLGASALGRDDSFLHLSCTEEWRCRGVFERSEMVTPNPGTGAGTGASSNSRVKGQYPVFSATIQLRFLTIATLNM